MTPSSLIVVHTDGACLGNPGPGGWACRLRLPSGIQEFAGGDPATTNNRMELQAAIEALRRTPAGLAVHLHTDSQYVIKGLTEWLPGWKWKILAYRAARLVDPGHKNRTD